MSIEEREPVFSPGEVTGFGILSAVLAALVVAATMPWSRSPARLLSVAIGVAGAYVGWYGTLRSASATSFDHDAPIIRISWADAGVGIVAIAFVALLLGLASARDEPSRRVVSAAAISGLLATFIDLWVI